MERHELFRTSHIRTGTPPGKLSTCYFQGGFPLPLPSNTGDLVFDPFCGSGTTGVVCKKQNRKFVGIDNNIEYLNIAKKRLASTSNRNNGSFVKKLNV